jgi:ribose-phosphate pyrophosphokinase
MKIETSRDQRSKFMKLFLAHSAEHLRRFLEKHEVPIARHERFFFADQERGYRIREKMKGKRTAIIACVLPDSESFFELLALHRVIRENGATRIDVVIPYLGYARQDRPDRVGEASIGLMVAEIIRSLKGSRLILFDLHSPRIRKILGRSIAELSAFPLFAEVLSNSTPQVIVSPDAGSMRRARQLAKLFRPQPEVAMVEKFRPRPNVAIAKRLHGDVRRKDVLVVDDIIDTGGTVAEAVRLIAQHGSGRIQIAATHGIFSGDARERLSTLPIERILVTNTLPQAPDGWTHVLDIVPLLLQRIA